jgi:Fic family protein
MINEYHYLATFKPKGYPVRHRHKDPFDPEIMVTPEFISRVRKIREMDQEFERFFLSADDYFDLVTSAYASNIHWSTKLEGNPLSEGEVRRVTLATLSGHIQERAPGPVQEIINYLVHLFDPEPYGLPWTHDSICSLNRYLLEGTGNNSKIGAYRNKFAIVGDTTTGEEHFIPAPPEHIRAEMSSLLEWTKEKALAYEPIAAATVMFHEFESIHPFEDGNGRTGRCLFHLYLQDRALKNSHLCKIDRMMVEDQELYYDLLGYADESGSYKELNDFVSIAVLKGYEEAYSTLSKKDLLGADIDEQSRRILIKARAHKDTFSVAQARDWIGTTSEQTIRKRLSELVERGALESFDKTRSLRYRIKDPLAEFKGLLKGRKMQ